MKRVELSTDVIEVGAEGREGEAAGVPPDAPLADAALPVTAPDCEEEAGAPKLRKTPLPLLLLLLLPLRALGVLPPPKPETPPPIEEAAAEAEEAEEGAVTDDEKGPNVAQLTSP